MAKQEMLLPVWNVPQRIKARRYYWLSGVQGFNDWSTVPAERVYVVGFTEINGERWCRIRYDGEKTSRLLAHPSNLCEGPAIRYNVAAVHGISP